MRSTRWLTWGTYADDYFPAVFGRTRDILGARVFHERLAAFMPADGAAMPAPVNPVERGLADLWPATAAPLTVDTRHQFRSSTTSSIGYRIRWTTSRCGARPSARTSPWVLVIERFLSCTPQQAMGIAHDLMTARIQQFEHVASTELPVLYRERELDGSTRAAIEGYVRQLRDWMTGVVHWHRGTRRYDRAEPVGVSGLGLSALRLPGGGQP